MFELLDVMTGSYQGSLDRVKKKAEENLARQLPESQFIRVNLQCFRANGTELKPTEEWSRIEQVQKEYDELVEELEHSREVRNAISESCNKWKSVAHQRALALKELKSSLSSALEEIVVTSGVDMGVILKDSEGVSKYDPDLNYHVYEHEHFSELGDALIALWKMLNEQPECSKGEAEPQ